MAQKHIERGYLQSFIDIKSERVGTKLALTMALVARHFCESRPVQLATAERPAQPENLNPLACPPSQLEPSSTRPSSHSKNTLRCRDRAEKCKAQNRSSSKCCQVHFQILNWNQTFADHSRNASQMQYIWPIWLPLVLGCRQAFHSMLPTLPSKRSVLSQKTDATDLNS